MSKSLRSPLDKWLFGCGIGASLLVACSMPGDEGTTVESGARQAEALRQSKVKVLLSTEQAVVGAQEAATVTVTLRNDSPLRYDVEALHLHGAGKGGTLKSGEVAMWIEGRASGQAQEDSVTAQVTSSISFMGRCSSTQESIPSTPSR
jgi:hypothetical protein